MSANGGPRLASRLVASSADVTGWRSVTVRPPSSVAVGPSTTPPGGDGVVEAEVLGQSGGLVDDLGVGDGRDGQLARPVVTDHQIDRDIDPARRQHAQQDEDERGTADHEETGWRMDPPMPCMFAAR